MFQTPASRTSTAPIGRTLSCAPSGGSGSDEDDKENRCPNKDPPAEPNVDERKRNQKRLRDDEEEQSGVQDELESPGKKLEPRQLTYPEDDALGGIASMRDDNQEEVVPLTQPYPPESPQPASQEQQPDSQEEVVPETPQEEEYPPGHPKAKADTSMYIRPRYYMADVTNEEIANSASQWF